MDSSQPSTTRRALGIFAALLFWIWNLVFLSFGLFGALPYALSAGDWGLALPVLVLSLVPFVALALGFRRGPTERVRLLYGFEAPLVAIAALRFFAVQEVSLAVGLSFGALALCAAAQLWTVLRAPPRNLVLHTASLAVGAWVALMASLYALPLGWMTLEGFFAFEWFGEVSRAIIQSQGAAAVGFAAGVALFLATATLWLAAPFALSALLYQGFHRAYSAAGRARLVTVGLTVGLLTAGFTLSAQQDPGATLKLAEDQSPEQLDDRMDPDLQEALVDIYTADRRYFGVVGREGLLGDLYAKAFKIEEETQKALLKVHDALAAPFLYGGAEPSTDRRRAAEAFREVFDGDIARRPEAIDVRRRAGGWRGRGFNAHPSNVRLEAQALTVEPHGGWAQVELRETYLNMTRFPQEVRYDFSLPANAVATGLWLGTPEAPRHFVGAVSPRGAARKVYEAQVRRSLDPALLEQLGPRQYRLRVFPVPACFQKPCAEHAKRMVMTLRYVTLPEAGRWPLPRLIDRRNVHWTPASRRTLAERDFEAEAWMPAGPEAPERSRVEARVGDHRVVGEPVESQPAPEGRRIAVIVDRSWSMRAHRESLEAALLRLSEIDGVRAFTTAAPASGLQPRESAPAAVDLEAFPAVGRISLPEMLAQAPGSWDAVLVLTDGSGLETLPPQPPMGGAQGPLWLVHLDGDLPAAYPDSIHDRLRRAGGVTTSVDEALACIVQPDRFGGMRWRIEADPAPVDAPPGLAALAAAQVVREHARAEAPLADLHALAKAHNLVSPWSSLIVLVNEAQWKQLAEAEAQSDAFERKPTPASGLESTPFGLSGTPEPATWALILLALGLYTQRERLLA